MWPNLVIYVSSPDISLLYMLLNAVAMISAQSNYIWAFALLASLWKLFSTSAGGALHAADGSAGAVLARGAMSSFFPFLFALMLTAPGMKTRVDIESLMTGTTNTVANVPAVVVLAPSVASILGRDLGELVGTAVQGTNADYSYLDSLNNGFLNPLKVTLAARSAMMKLNSVDTEVRLLVADCLVPGTTTLSTSDIVKAVRNAGNTGATAANSMVINGITVSALGAMLNAASTSTNYAPSVPTADGQLLSCSDAAAKVGQDVQDAITGVEFPRVVQGAVNGLDDPVVGADFSFSAQSSGYRALRSLALGAGTVGQTQADAEWLNILTSELVDNNLQCLNAQNSSKVVCETTMMQSTEMERTNIANDAAVVPVLKYAGAFGNYMVALVIALGPIIMMFMMFSGFGATKAMMTVVHICLWPVLVLNLGAEIINAMILHHVSVALQSIANGGYISLAVVSQVYKEMSLQVGVGSSMMASLSAIMSMIFALGEFHSLRGAEQGGKPQGDDTQRLAAPQVAAAQPMVGMQPGISARRVGEDGMLMTPSGSAKGFASNSAIGQVARDAYTSTGEMMAKSKSGTEAHDFLNSVRNGTSASFFRSHNFSESESIQLAKSLTDSLSSGSHDSISSEGATGSTTQTTASQGRRDGWNVSAGTGGGRGGRGGRPGISLGGEYGNSSSDGTDAQANTRTSNSGNHRDDVADMHQIHDTLTKMSHQQAAASHGDNSERSWSRALEDVGKYGQSITKTEEEKRSAGEDLKRTTSFVMSQGNFDSASVGNFSDTNPEFASFMTNGGMRLAASRGFSAVLEDTKDRMANDSMEHLTNPTASRNLAMLNAAVRASQDESLPQETRLEALHFATGALSIMNGIRLPAGDGAGASLGVKVGDPKNPTGIHAGQLSSRATAAKVGPLTTSGASSAHHGAGRVITSQRPSVAPQSGGVDHVREPQGTGNLLNFDERLRAGQDQVQGTSQIVRDEASRRRGSARDENEGTPRERVDRKEEDRKSQILGRDGFLWDNEKK